jgi:cation transport ATPase
MNSCSNWNLTDKRCSRGGSEHTTPSPQRPKGVQQQQQQLQQVQQHVQLQTQQQDEGQLQQQVQQQLQKQQQQQEQGQLQQQQQDHLQQVFDKWLEAHHAAVKMVRCMLGVSGAACDKMFKRNCCESLPCWLAGWLAG